MPRIALAPMMNKTEPHFRYFIRQLFPEMWLYTEMISAAAIIYGRRFLRLDPCEAPVALQLGTHCPEEGYRAVLLARQFAQDCHFAEYNLNAGCPSERVQNRRIGAVLMRDGPLVADILAAMRQALRDTQQLYPEQKLPQVTLKCRLGVIQNSRDTYQPEQLYHFLQQVAPHCERLIVHARLAVLEGLNPEQNREIPPLDYASVFCLRQNLPVAVELNGGLKNYAQIAAVWPHVDGVMLGRLSYENTWELFHIRQQLRANGWLHGKAKVRSRSELAGLYASYLEQHPSQQSISTQVWPLLNIWCGLPEARRWRRRLSPPYPAGLTAGKLARQAQQFMQELEEKYPTANP